MKRLPLLLSVLVFPLAAMAAEPQSALSPAAVSPWAWCKPDPQGQLGAGAPERAELVISGTALSGRLFVGDKEYARLSGVMKPASKNTDATGATTGVWEISATAVGADGAAHPLALKGVYTRHQSAEGELNTVVGSYETLALAAVDGGTQMIISRMPTTKPMRWASR